ncbi:MAG: DNA polymerase/3'-5' exonuclease PolX [Chloroflexota bacterium]|nr:DNA polymerase/3'-5' exonuclease PolX [Chloroflexota bacterium]
MPRRVASAGAHLPSQQPSMNAHIARVFAEIADMLEILGEVVYKAVAYRRVADAVERHPEDVAALYRAGTPPKIVGAGPALQTKLHELAETGQLEYYDRLRAQVPDGLLDMLRVQGVGPRTVKLLHDELGIDSVEALGVAVEIGALRGVKGLSERTEQNILAGIAHLDRRSTRLLIHDADRLVGELIARLREVRGVVAIEPAGSLRRRHTTIGDLDLLAAADDPAALIAALDALPEVDRVLAAGVDKSSVVLADGPQVDLMVCAPAALGTHLVHFTGSKEHNVRLRGRALDRGLSLSEKGFKVVETGELVNVATEEEVYARLDLPWIPPELREDAGEVEAALAGRLPRLLELGDLRGDTHTHSDWTDGVHPIAEMARAARALGREYIVLTDHSPSLGITRGLTVERVRAQRDEVRRLNAELAPFRILHGTEMEILADGTLDYPDEFLAGYDVVIASIHSGQRQPVERLTERALAAIENPHVDVIAHPSGRIVNGRDGYRLDWMRVFDAAARTGTLLEINASPRMDLDAELARAAADRGARLTVATDSHRLAELEHLRYGVDIARRAWLTADQVATSRSADELLALIGRTAVGAAV